MHQCKECELAIYCYSEASTWIFRTLEEMVEKQAAISNCRIREEIQRPQATSLQGG